jgi:hypothetical protein
LGGLKKRTFFWFVGILFLFFCLQQLLFLFSDNIASLYQQQKCHKKGQMKMSLTCYKLNYISCSTQKDWKGKQNQFFCCVIKTRKLQQYFLVFSLSMSIQKYFQCTKEGSSALLKWSVKICFNHFECKKIWQMHWHWMCCEVRLTSSDLNCFQK